MLKHGMTMIGTVMLKIVGIPTEIKDITNREVFSTELYSEEKGKRNPTSYNVNSNKKNIIKEYYCIGHCWATSRSNDWW